jgi:iron(III) transport system substrate-binding protein
MNGIAALSVAVLAVLLSPIAAAPEPVAVTPQLVEAAKKEGKVVLYTAIDLVVAEKIAKAFEAAYPGITVAIERTGGERIFQRVAQERANNIFAVDVLDASDQALFITWKRLGVLDAFLPAELAAKWPATQRDADGFFASERFTLMPLAYNTKLVSAADAPKSFANLLDPKWAGKIVKAHPGYSGGIVTSTFQTARDLGWDYFEKLGKQRVLQVQSATDPPKKLALGERAVEADGLEYVLHLLKEKGDPIEIVYPSEGTPFIPGSAAIAERAPHPNAARLFYSYLFSREAQQFIVDAGGMRSFHPDVAQKSGRTLLAGIKLMRSDPETQEKDTEAIKRNYSKYFGI